MKLLKKIILSVPNLDPSMNVITVTGRSGLPYNFGYSLPACAHVREYTGFEDSAAIERLKLEDADMTDATLGPGWVIRRAFVFEEEENEFLERGKDLMRRLNLRLMWNVNKEAAAKTFTDEELEMVQKPLAREVTEFLKTLGVRTPNELWSEEHQNDQREVQEIVETVRKAQGGVNASGVSDLQPLKNDPNPTGVLNEATNSPPGEKFYTFEELKELNWDELKTLMAQRGVQRRKTRRLCEQDFLREQGTPAEAKAANKGDQGDTAEAA